MRLTLNRPFDQLHGESQRVVLNRKRVVIGGLPCMARQVSRTGEVVRPGTVNLPALKPSIVTLS